MSEYIEIESEISEDGRIYLYTNLPLTEGQPESYTGLEAMEEGSPVAQALSIIEGLTSVQIEDGDLLITPEPEVATHVIIAEVTAVLKDFFL